MRIGFYSNRAVANINYRAGFPALALREAGHTVEALIQDRQQPGDFERFRRCDVVHIYRRGEGPVRGLAAALQDVGVAVTWDNDDDIRLMPPDAMQRSHLGRFDVVKDFQFQMKMLQCADLVTTTTKFLGDRYRAAGAFQVVEIENYLHKSQYHQRDGGHDGVVVGWVAGHEHRADADQLSIVETLARVLENKPQVRVVTVGLRLNLDATRYTHHPPVQPQDLPGHTGHFDIGIAPLADIPMSYARSSIKVKEYGAAGVPWLASARGPYVGLGSAQGGRLVGDDEWQPAIEALANAGWRRRRLARRASAWARSQNIANHIDQWVAIFEQAIENRRVRGPRTSRTRGKYRARP